MPCVIELGGDQSAGDGLGLDQLTALRADQPIFNEMPRWNGGWGVQGIYEYRHNPDLLDGDSVVSSDLSESVHLFHLEGVYTWKRWIRLTAKVPYVIHAERELLSPSGPIKKTLLEK